MVDLASSVLPAIDRLAAMGIVDPERVGAMGHSDGGYDVVSLIVETRRLKAAVMISGYGDLFSEYGFLRPDGSSYCVAQIEKRGNHALGVTPWGNAQRYVENSPAYYLDRVETPLLIVHGADDLTVPSYLSDQLFVGLRRLGKRAEYAKYQQEGHVQDVWSYDHRLDSFNRVVQWFEQYLKSTSSGADSSFQQAPIR